MTHVLFSLNNDKFIIQNTIGQLNIVNKTAILVRPGKAFVLPLGLYIQPPQNTGLIIYGTLPKKLIVHNGIIDSGYRGEVKAVIFNKTSFNKTIRPGEMTLTIAVFSCFSDDIDITPENGKILSQPKYKFDAGRDVHLKCDMLLYPYSTFYMTMGFDPPKSDGYKPVFFGRSGLALKGIHVTPNKWRCVYSKIAITNYSSEVIVLNRGDRFCQVVYMSKESVPSKYETCADIVKIGQKFRFQPAHLLFLENPAIEIKEETQNTDNPNSDDQDTTSLQHRNKLGFGSSGMT